MEKDASGKMTHGPTKHHQFKSFNIKVNLSNKLKTERPNNILRQTFPKVYVRYGRIWIHGQQEAYHSYYLIRTKEIKIRVSRIC